MSKRPRILLLITDMYGHGGIQRFNRTFVAALSGLGVDCDVLSMQDSSASIAKGDPLPNANVRGFCGNRLRFSAATLRAVWRHDYNWIVIGHINLLAMALAMRSIRPFTSSRTVLISHGIEVWYTIGKLRRFALAHLSCVLCVSRYTRRRILDQVPSLKPERLKLFPNALSNSWTSRKRPTSAETLRNRFILSVTRIEKGDRYKGIVTVIEALSMLEDRDLEYLIVGHGNDLEFLRSVARRCGVADRVHFLNGISDAEMIALYEQCEAFVLPSGNEGFGIVFLEAMFFGAPVIAAAEKGTLDVVLDRETGLLVRFGDSAAVMHAIERLSADDVLRETIRRRGRETVLGTGEFAFARFVQRSAEFLEIEALGAA